MGNIVFLGGERKNPWPELLRELPRHAPCHYAWDGKVHRTPPPEGGVRCCFGAASATQRAQAVPICWPVPAIF